ncbi:MAG: metalloregulator ArsR/SmtB family transcription factor [Planctomycetota bacterium]
MQTLLRLLSEPTRLRILAAVDGEELAVGEIADVLGMSQSRISNHLRLLKEGDALDGRREGSWTFYKNALPTDPAAASLWNAVKAGIVDEREFKADLARRRAVLEKRRERSRAYFAAGRNGHAEVGMQRDSLREELLAALLPHDWTVLDAGCGDGYLTEALAARFDRVIAVDHAPARLAEARRRLGAAGVEFEEGEIDDLPLRAGTVDAVFFSMVLHHVPIIGDATHEAMRVLKPGGFVAIADFAPHHDEAMRAELGDLRLGLDPDAIAAALEDAGFERVATAPARDRYSAGRGDPLSMFLATGRKPARSRSRKKSTATTRS